MPIVHEISPLQRKWKLMLNCMPLKTLDSKVDFCYGEVKVCQQTPSLKDSRHQAYYEKWLYSARPDGPQTNKPTLYKASEACHWVIETTFQLNIVLFSLVRKKQTKGKSCTKYCLLKCYLYSHKRNLLTLLSHKQY